MTFTVAFDTDAGETKSILHGIEVVEDLNCSSVVVNKHWIFNDACKGSWVIGFYNARVQSFLSGTDFALNVFYSLNGFEFE